MVVFFICADCVENFFLAIFCLQVCYNFAANYDIFYVIFVCFVNLAFYLDFWIEFC